MSHVDEGALHAYLDGELPPAERAALEAHVAECPACRARLTEERALLERASQLLGLAQPLERPAPPLHQLRQRRVVRRLRLPFAWAASIVLAVSLGYYLHGTDSGVVPEVRSRASSAEEDRAAAPPVAVDAPRRSPPPSTPQRPSERRQVNAPQKLADEPTGAATAKARADAVTPTADAMAIRSEAQLRRGAPPPITGVAPRVEVSAGGTDWPLVRREQVRQMLGSEPVGIPSLPVRSIRRDPVGDGGVLVEQELDSATVIQLFERPATAERPASGLVNRSAAPARQFNYTDRLARFVGTLRVEIAGPLSPDSLNRLLEQVKPLP